MDFMKNRNEMSNRMETLVDFTREDGEIVQIPADAVEYVFKNTFDDGSVCNYYIDWDRMYLDKIGKTPKRAVGLMNEYRRRKNTYIHF
jgi:hypothetical protein